MVYSLLLFSLLFISCAKNSDIDKKPFVKINKKSSEPTFSKYISQFRELSHTKVKTVIYFGNTEGNAGTCYMYDSGYTEIAIDKTYWNTISEEQKQQLIFHELGHCELDREHEDGYDENNCPVSIMRSWAFNEEEINNCYIPERENYTKELFK